MSEEIQKENSELQKKKEQEDAMEYEKKIAELEADKLELITKKLLNSEMFNNSGKTISTEVLDVLDKSDTMYQIILDELSNLRKIDMPELEKKVLFGELMVNLMKVAGEQNKSKLESIDKISKFIPKQTKTQINQAQSLKVDDIIKNNNNFGTKDYIGVLEELSNQGLSMISAIRIQDKDTYGVTEEEPLVIIDDEDDFGEADKYEDEIDFESIKRNVAILEEGDEDEIQVIHSPNLDEFK